MQTGRTVSVTGETMIKQALFSLIAITGFAGVNLKPGEAAPLFQAQDQHGRTIQLRDFQGKAVVVLYFYPKDGTPGCTAEACSLRDGYEAFLATGSVVLGVSADDAVSHASFAGKYNLPFSLLADPERKIIDAYGVKMFGLDLAKRWTFIIDKQGIIRHIISDVRTQDHDKQVLELLKGVTGS